MKKHLIEMVGKVQSIIDDAWNPDTYFDNRIIGNDGMMHTRYLLGNLFAKGYDERTHQNFEIYKDHGGWQVWVWQFDEQKNPDRNNFNTAYYNYDKLVEYIEKTF